MPEDISKLHLIKSLNEEKEFSDGFPPSWPKTHIDVGDKDPLFDSSLLLMQKMVEAKVDCSCTIYSGFYHGFLNLDFVIPEAKTIIRNSVKVMQNLLK